MRILGLDQSYTNSGVVVLEANESNTTTLIHFETIKTPKEMNVYERAWKIASHIVDICNTHAVDCVCIEGLAYGMRGDATRDLAGLQFVIVSRLMNEHGRKVEIVTPKSLKKFATNDGSASKKQMIAALPLDVAEKFKGKGFKLTTGLADLADSFFLASFGVNNLKTVEGVG